MAELTKEELDERVALLKHFKNLLEQQRAKFREYLLVLEKQESSIETENVDALLSHTELEQQVVKNITNLQKVIVPVKKMYDLVQEQNNNSDINNIQTELDDLQKKILIQNEKNRNLIRVHISQLKEKMDSFKNPYKNAASVYAQRVPVGNLIKTNA